MGLFADTERQAAQLAEDVVKRGKVVRIHCDAGGGELFRGLADWLPQPPVVIHVGAQTDAHLHAMLSAAAQCGPAAPAEVARALRDHRDVGAAMTALEQQLKGRHVLINRLERLEDGDELGMVFADARREVATRLAKRANVVMSIPQPAPGRVEHAETSVPAKVGSWDSATIWARCAGDVDLYELAAARMLTLRAGFDGSSDLTMLVRQFWLELNTAQRQLIGVLLTHRRAVPRLVLQLAELADAKVIDEAIGRHLMHESHGELTLPGYWLRGRDGVLLDEGPTHRRIAAGLESLVTHERWGPLATLEAHRHYTEIPDLARAKEHAAFGVEMLLDLGRRLSLADRRMDAASAYRAVIALAEQGSRVGARIESRALAYAIHYEAYNLYKGRREPSIDRTIARYREALSIWPENALFWSRLITAYFVAERFDEAMRARAQAYADVPDHPERDRFLTGRTVIRLLERGFVLAAGLALGDLAADLPLTVELRDAVLRAWQEAPPATLWSAIAGRVGIAGVVSLTWESGACFVATALERPGKAVTAAGAVAALVEALRTEVEALCVEAGSARHDRRRELVLHLRFDRGSTDEAVRWLEFLAELARAEGDGRLVPGQRDAMLGLWAKLRGVYPTLRRPAARISDDGTISLAWSYAEPAGFVFTVDLDRDGRLDWYLRDPTRELGEASESPELELPAHVVDRLAAVAA